MCGTNLLVKRASSLNVGIGIKFIGPEEIDAFLKLGSSFLDGGGSGPSGLGGGHGEVIQERGELKWELQNQIKERRKRILIIEGGDRRRNGRGIGEEEEGKRRVQREMEEKRRMIEGERGHWQPEENSTTLSLFLLASVLPVSD